MRINRRFAALLSLSGGVALLVGLSEPAAAEDPTTFTGETSLTLEYGQYWSFGAKFPHDYNREYTFITTGTPSGYTPQIYEGGHNPSNLTQLLATITAPYEVAPLSVGSYTFKLHVKGSYDNGEPGFETETAEPAKLTVTPAKLGVELRVIADPNHLSGAVVTAKFTGRFVDEYSSSFFPGSAQSPAGTWNIQLKDADGEVATERSVERAAGDDVLATSFYWADAEVGEAYTASASFTPSGASGANFSVSAAPGFSYTAPPVTRPVPTSSATAKPDISLPEPTGLGLPLWTLILVGVLIAGLGVLVTILSVRLRRRSSSSAGEVQS